MQKFLEAFLRLGAETLAVAEEQLEDLSEEERQVEGELEVRHLLDRHQPVQQKLPDDRPTHLDFIGQRIDEGLKVEGQLVQHCLVDHRFE